MACRRVIVVVEDDMELNQLERDLLGVHGLDSVAAYTGPEAIEVMKQAHADGVLLDLMLPEMDGYETCRCLRDQEDRHVPVVIVSALDSDEARRKGMEAGADAYFSKPFDPSEVINTLEMLMNANGDGAGEADQTEPREKAREE